MDRRIAYVGEIPLVDDVLYPELHAYISVSKLAAAVLGTNTQINGFTCIPTIPASLNVVVTPGEIYQTEAIDVTAYGDLPTNSTQILKQGINLANSANLPCPAPGTVGQSINYLIQIGWATIDTGSTLLPYYNAANPSQAFSGANNNAVPNNTVRQDYANIQVKAGTAATTGTQTTPSPDSGFVGAFVVTVAHGATTVIAGNITTYTGAPFIPNTLTGIASVTAVQNNQYNFASDTGAANTYLVSLTPALTSYVTGSLISVLISNTNTNVSTINVNSLGVKSIVLSNGNPLTGFEMIAGKIAELKYNGTAYELLNPASLVSYIQFQNNTQKYAIDTGTANTYLAAPTPAFTAAGGTYVNGMEISVLIGNTNTGSSTINVSSIGVAGIITGNGNQLTGGELVSGKISRFIYINPSFQLQNPANTITQNNNQNYTTSSSAANTYTATFSPVPVALIAGMNFLVKFTNANTSTATFNPNSLGASAIVTTGGAGLAAGQIAAAMVANLTYTGSNWQLNNPAFDNLATQKASNLSDLASIPTAKSNLVIVPLYKSSSYALAANDETIVFTAAGTATLPTAAGRAGKVYAILNNATTNVNVTIATTSSQTISLRPSSDIVLTQYGDYIVVQSDGTNWIILAKLETTYLSNSGTQSVSGVTGSYQANAATVTVGIGKWKAKMYPYLNTGTSSVACAISYLTGFFAANGANTVTAPTSLSNITGSATYNALSGGGTYNPFPSQSNAGNMILLPIESEIVVTSSTQPIFAVVNATYTTATNFSVGSFVEVWRVF